MTDKDDDLKDPFLTEAEEEEIDAAIDDEEEDALDEEEEDDALWDEIERE